jgi:hypothetical protein
VVLLDPLPDVPVVPVDEPPVVLPGIEPDVVPGIGVPPVVVPLGRLTSVGDADGVLVLLPVPLVRSLL